VNGAIQRLRAEIASDRGAFAGQLEELGRVSLVPDAPPGDLARAAVALHHGYSALESIFVRTARHLEGGAPDGPGWHQALLESMALELEGIRPAVLSVDSVSGLRQLFGFRHFFRHAYSAPLDAARLSHLRDVAFALRARLDAELDALDALLRSVAG
jgi:hypothetical protein